MTRWNEDVFPSEIRNTHERYGQYADHSGEGGYIRCRRCGWIINKYRHHREERGVNVTTGSYYQGIGYGWGWKWGQLPWGGSRYAQYYGDPSVAGGCPQCGAQNE
jgi:DNA-directed RNA polymerase subunit RPC12/RpoP